VVPKAVCLSPGHWRLGRLSPLWALSRPLEARPRPGTRLIYFDLFQEHQDQEQGKAPQPREQNSASPPDEDQAPEPRRPGQSIVVFTRSGFRAGLDQGDLGEAQAQPAATGGHLRPSLRLKEDRRAPRLDPPTKPMAGAPTLPLVIRVLSSRPSANSSHHPIGIVLAMRSVRSTQAKPLISKGAVCRARPALISFD
jgi:hypothetical protein